MQKPRHREKPNRNYESEERLVYLDKSNPIRLPRKGRRMSFAEEYGNMTVGEAIELNNKEIMNETIKKTTRWN